MRSTATLCLVDPNLSKSTTFALQLTPESQACAAAIADTPPESLASNSQGSQVKNLVDIGKLSDVQENVPGRVVTEEQPSNGKLAGAIPLEVAAKEPEPPVFLVTPKGPPYGPPRNSSKLPHPSSIAHLKYTLKDMLARITEESNFFALISLQGADGGVAVHKCIITYFSKLVRDELVEHPETCVIHLPEYSSRILRKLVSLLYTGEVYYNVSEREDVNLIWDLMRNLMIPFDEKSFYYHPVKVSVKVEVEEDEHADLMVPPEENPGTEVDQTDWGWVEDPSAPPAPPYVGIYEHPDPENPSRSIQLHVEGEQGLRIRMIKKAVSQAQIEVIERENEQELQQQDTLVHTPIVVEIFEDEHDNTDGKQVAPKKRLQFSPGTRVLPATTGVDIEELKRHVTMVGLANIRNAAAEPTTPIERINENEIKEETSEDDGNTSTGQEQGSLFIPASTPWGTSVAVRGFGSFQENELLGPNTGMGNEPLGSDHGKENETMGSTKTNQNQQSESVPALMARRITSVGAKRCVSPDIIDTPLTRSARAAVVVPAQKLNRYSKAKVPENNFSPAPAVASTSRACMPNAGNKQEQELQNQTQTRKRKYQADELNNGGKQRQVQSVQDKIEQEQLEKQQLEKNIKAKLSILNIREKNEHCREILIGAAPDDQEHADETEGRRRSRVQRNRSVSRTDSDTPTPSTSSASANRAAKGKGSGGGRASKKGQ